MKALIVTDDRFPNGNAGAIRQECLAKIIISCGYDVDIICMGESTNFKYKKIEKFSYISYRNSKQNVIIRIMDRLLFPYRVIKEIKNKKYDLLLTAVSSKKILDFFKKYKEKTNCNLIYDSVEWYSPCEFKLGIFSPTYIKNNLLITKWIDDNFNIIAISSYLQNYFKSKGLNCVRIPFILDTTLFKNNKKTNSSKITFIYAGMIGKKDHLKNFFEALSMLNEEEIEKIEVKIYGCTYNYLKKTGNINNHIYKRIKESIKIFGRVRREIITKNLEDANFSILFRDSNERYAKAGFPTKLVESLTCSTPIFCNISSDLGMYLQDQYNSIICKNESKFEILQNIKRIISLNNTDLIMMKNNSRNTAIKYFDCRNFIEEFKHIMIK